MTENITILWNEYQKAKLYMALRGDFDFTSDYEAYEAFVTGDGATLARLTSERLPGTTKPNFKKGQRRLAQKAYAEAQGRHSVKAEGPMNFVRIVKDSAEFSDERRSTVETPFGTDADNSEALS